jgi:hypothetical protein
MDLPKLSAILLAKITIIGLRVLPYMQVSMLIMAMEVATSTMILKP